MNRLSISIAVRLMVPLVALLAGSCAPSSDSADRHLPAPTTTPATQSALELPSVTLTDGLVVTLELALTPEEIGQGLMYRPHLPEDRGMLFLFQVERVPSFWMKNTMIPLALLFLDDDGVIVEIIANAQPCAAEPCPQYIPSRAAWAVLELNAGAADRHGLAAGDQLQFENVEGYPHSE